LPRQHLGCGTGSATPKTGIGCSPLCRRLQNV
jgi:hypothetical protein